LNLVICLLSLSASVSDTIPLRSYGRAPKNRVVVFPFVEVEAV
jgi:hypothetical protein